MKIAVSCNGNQIWAHFGHCENFMIYEAENGVITSEQSVPNPGHRPGFLPNFLADMGVAVIISGGMGGGVTYVAESGNPSYHPGRCAKVYVGDKCLGTLGQVHPHVAANYGVDCELYAAELDFAALLSVMGPDPVYQPLPRFPAVSRDIAVVCDEAVTVGALETAIRKGAKGLLKEVALFDIYRGKGIPEGKKSVAFNLVLRADDRSLTAEEADQDVKSILETLDKELGAVLR